MRKVNPEYAKAIMAIANRAPYLKLLGMKICELDYGYCRVETQINDSLNNPFASVHGGVFSSILDTAYLLGSLLLHRRRGRHNYA